MINPDILESLPEDAEEAFLVVEENLRQQLMRSLNEKSSISAQHAYGNYMNMVVAAVDGLNVDAFSDWAEQSYITADQQYAARLIAEVDRFRMRKALEKARSNKTFSVSLDDTLRSKIRHHLGSITELIQAAEIDADKKDSLMEKLGSFREELERNRTKLQYFSSIFVGVCSAVNKGYAELKPAIEKLEKISSLLGDQKDEEERLEKEISKAHKKLIQYQKKIEFKKTSDDCQPDN